MGHMCQIRILILRHMFTSWNLNLGFNTFKQGSILCHLKNNFKLASIVLTHCQANWIGIRVHSMLSFSLGLWHATTYIIKHKVVSTKHSGGKVANKVHSGGCYHYHYFINISTWCTYLGICNSKKCTKFLYPFFILFLPLDICKTYLPQKYGQVGCGTYIYIYIYEKSKCECFSNFSNVLMFSIMPICLNIFGSTNHWTQWSIPKTKWIYTKASQISLVVSFYHVCVCLGLGGRAPCFIEELKRKKKVCA
jgi:hypothetical protein